MFMAKLSMKIKTIYIGRPFKCYLIDETQSNRTLLYQRHMSWICNRT